MLRLACAFALFTSLFASLLALPARAAELETVFFETQLDDVEKRATARLRQRPDDPTALAWRAEVLMKQGSFAAARDDLARLPVGTRDAAIARGDYAWYTGDWAGAEAAYGDALKTAPDDMHAAWGVASAVLHQDRYDEAERQALALMPRALAAGPVYQAWVLVVQGGAVGLRADRGNLLDKLRHGPAARAAFEAALKAAPEGANALSAMGRFCLLAPWVLGGDGARAIQLLAKSNAVDPFFYLNHAALIRAYVATGLKDKARVEAAFYRAKFSGIPAAERELAGLAP